jgi:hypothetical protein
MSSVGTQRNTFNDASGRVTVAVFSHQGSPGQAHWNEEEILVGDPDMIAIGGGGTATDVPQGNLLTSSHPNDDLSGWVVSSKDHEVPNPVELVTYVIGLKIAGMSRQDLLHSVFVSQADSGVAPHPEAETGVPSDEFVLVGGGFRIDWHGAGNLATASFPSTEFSWKARSKDHDISDPANLHIFAIGLRRNLPVGKVVGLIERADSGQANHPAADATLAPGFVLTGGGAEVHFNGDGNLLWRLEPSTSLNPSFSAASKDHMHPDPSTLTTYALGIRLAVPDAQLLSVDTSNEEVGWGFRMQTSVKLVKQSGLLDAVTHTWSTNDFLGFTGGVTIWLKDANGIIIDQTDLQTFGVDGRDVPFTQSSRLDHWSQNFDVAKAARVVDLQVVHSHSPQSRLIADMDIIGKAGAAAKKQACSLYPGLFICK